MKKIFAILVALTLVFSLSLGVFATEGEELTTPNGEIVTDGEISTPTDGTTEDATEDITAENAESFVKNLIDKLGNSSIWVSIGTVAAALLGIVGILHNKFGALFSLLSGKADTATLTAEVKKSGAEISEAFAKQLAEVKDKLDDYQDNEKKMWAIITIFMTHAKISPAVKVEIMNRITGIKDMTGTLTEILEDAERSIAETEEAEKALAPDTPALDSLVKEAAEVSEASEPKTEYITL